MAPHPALPLEGTAGFFHRSAVRTPGEKETLMEDRPPPDPERDSQHEDLKPEGPPPSAGSPQAAPSQAGSPQGASPQAASPQAASPQAASPQAKGDLGRSREKRGGQQRKYYCLDMFPYPSLGGFTVNQLRGIAITDVVARYQEARGREVLRPIGWDSFGLSIEEEAQARQLSPQEVVSQGIEVMRGQLKEFGARVDWDREVSTADPSFYRWTQWLFLKLLEEGLAYREEVPMKWCPRCSVNLANEEVVAGNCVHCQSPVEERQISQWLVRITRHA
ncbi:MAG: class I tRNA ligase family protein, partial [Planctomycetota bacterium]